MLDEEVYPDWASDAIILIAVHCSTSPQHIHIQDTDMDNEIEYFLILDQHMQQRKIALPDLYFSTFSGVHTLH